MQPATRLRRVVAVVLDFFVLYALWAAVGIAMAQFSHQELSGLGLVVYFLLIDLPLTALQGASPGRFLAGIRVRRTVDGSAPGWPRAALRIALVAVTGLAGMLYWTIALGVEHYSDIKLGRLRLWWDAAAGTDLVRV